MNKITIFIVAILSVTFAVTVISTSWLFIPALVENPDASYLISQALSFSALSAIVTGVIVVVIGIPVYLSLERKGKASQTNLALAGFIIPVTILIVISLLTATGGNGSYSSGQNYHGTYRSMVVDNERTFWGWVSMIEQYLTFGIYGLFGATLFGNIISIFERNK